MDEDGALHLTISQDEEGRWLSTEIVLLDRLGYGTYSVQTISQMDALDANAVFGAYTWDNYADDVDNAANIHREIDIEDSLWGGTIAPDNAQFVVQPFGQAGHLYRYQLPDLSDDAAMTSFFTWGPESVDFVSLAGHYSPVDDPQGVDRAEWTFVHDPESGAIVPQPGREQFRLNLWLYDTDPSDGLLPEPGGGETVEVVVSGFEFLPLPTVTLSLDQTAIAETGGEATVTATLSNPTTQDVTVDLGYSGTATGDGTDYTASATQIVIPAGQTTGTVTITAIDDLLDEPDETVVVDVTSVTNGTESDTQQVTTTIVDAMVPEINVQGNGMDITDGDTSPSPDDHTDFGAQDVISGVLTRTFTIQNTGNSELILSGSPAVTIFGAGAADFSVVVQPSPANIAAGESTTFVVEFNPVAAGVRTASISIDNNDGDEAPYNFDIQGTGLASVLIVDGDSLEVSEAGPSSDTYAIALSATPTAAVTIDIVAGTGVSVSPASLTFTPDDYDLPQTVTVTAIDDQIAQGRRFAPITHTSSSTDPYFDAMAIDDVMALVVDDEVGDQFGRPDAVELGPDWSVPVGNFALSNEEAVCTDPSQPALALHVHSDAVEADGIRAECDVDLTSTLGHFGVALRVSADGMSLYLGAIAFDGSFATAHIWKRVNGVWTPLLITSIPGNPRSGRLQFDAFGSSLILRLDGSPIANATDTELDSGGFAGVRGTNGIRFDNVNIVPLMQTVVPVPYDADFDLDDGPLPSEWQERVGDFAIVDNGAKTADGGTAVLNTETSLENTIVEADVNLQAGNNAHMGLVARYAGPQDQSMYLGALVRQGVNIFADIWVNQDGDWLQLVHQLVSDSGSGQGRLRFHVHGDKLQLSLDGSVVAWATDSRISQAGRVGFRGSANESIDNFHVETSTQEPANEVDGLVVENGSFTVTSPGHLTANLPKSIAVDESVAATADVTVSAQVALPASGLSAVGLVTRYNGPADDNYYWGTLVRDTDDSLTLRIYSCVNGVTEHLASRAASASAGTLAFSTIGQTLRLTLGTEELSITNSLVTGAGYAGLRGFPGTTYAQLEIS